MKKIVMILMMSSGLCDAMNTSCDREEVKNTLGSIIKNVEMCNDCDLEAREIIKLINEEQRIRKSKGLDILDMHHERERHLRIIETSQKRVKEIDLALRALAVQIREQSHENKDTKEQIAILQSLGL